jgi:hypothetical protein
MADIIDVLQELGELAHWVQRPAPAPHGDLTYPAIISFCFKSNPIKAEEILEVAIASFQGDISWQFFPCSEGLWVIEPKRVPDLTEERGLLGDLDAALILSKEDPEFGLQSNRELESLADHIRTVARSISGAGRLNTQP